MIRFLIAVIFASMCAIVVTAQTSHPLLQRPDVQR